MKLREKTRKDYAAVHEGPLRNLNPHPRVSEKWSKTKLWRFEIIDERHDAVKVHWIGWSTKYDQWITRDSVVDIPSDVEESNAFSHLKHQLHVQVGL